MNRPPWKRNKSSEKRAIGERKKPQKTKRLSALIVIALLFSAFQYMNTGSVTWPGDLLGNITATLKEYPDRPEAGWRRAGEALETIGAAREGTPAPEFDITGRVVRVSDGDTVSVLDRNKKQHKIRLFGIDTPEREQAFGLAAKKALTELVANQQVGVVQITRDEYDRVVGTLYLDTTNNNTKDNTNINQTMVAMGYAWWYRYYAPHERHLEAAEKSARSERLGLWSDPNPEPPWDWRRARR